MKVKTQKKVPKKVKNETTGVENEVEEIIEVEEEVDDTVTSDIPEVAVVTEAIPEAKVPENPKDHVFFAFTEDVSPPPHIGFYDMALKHNITVARRGQKYLVPKHIAEVLLDKKKGVIA